MSNENAAEKFLSIPEPLCAVEVTHEAIGRHAKAGTRLASLRWMAELNRWGVEFEPDLQLTPSSIGRAARWLLMVAGWLEVHEFDPPMWAQRATTKGAA